MPMKLHLLGVNGPFPESRGATSGYLNPEELFYLRSRGIPEAEARRMQMISFITPVISHLPEELKEQILSRL